MRVHLELLLDGDVLLPDLLLDGRALLLDVHDLPKRPPSFALPWCDAGRGLAQHDRLEYPRLLPSHIVGHAAGRPRGVMDLTANLCRSQ